jgi:hypothetical protein
MGTRWGDGDVPQGARFMVDKYLGFKGLESYFLKGGTLGTIMSAAKLIKELKGEDFCSKISLLYQR